MKKTILLIVASITFLTVGCIGTARTDVGRSQLYKDGTGKRFETPSLSVGPIRISLGQYDANLQAAIDEPTAAVGTSIGSKTDVAALAASSERNPTNGTKVIKWGATDLSTEAQELKDILDELRRIKNDIPSVSTE